MGSIFEENRGASSLRPNEATHTNEISSNLNYDSGEDANEDMRFVEIVNNNSKNTSKKTENLRSSMKKVDKVQGIIILNIFKDVIIDGNSKKKVNPNPDDKAVKF